MINKNRLLIDQFFCVCPNSVTAVYVMEKDDYLITAGGNKITFYSFRNEDAITNFYPKKRKSIKSSHHTASSKATQNFNTSPVACFDISRCAQMVAVAAGRIFFVFLFFISIIRSLYVNTS